MWNYLYQIASPKGFYQRSQFWIVWLVGSTLITLLTGLVWGLVFAPSDYQQGDAFRIIYVHVPCALMSMALYAFMGFLALLQLIWRIKLAGVMIHCCAKVGACMALLALLTGSIWGKPMWGTWWIWDARLTSELILFLMYSAIIATASAHQNSEQSDNMVAVLTLVGLVDLPVIHYSVYWWNTLHQGATLSFLSKPKIAPSMLYPLLICLMGMALYCGLAIVLSLRNEILLRERHQQWVRQLLALGSGR